MRKARYSLWARLGLSLPPALICGVWLSWRTPTEQNNRFQRITALILQYCERGILFSQYVAKAWRTKLSHISNLGNSHIIQRNFWMSKHGEISSKMVTRSV